MNRKLRLVGALLVMTLALSAAIPPAAAASGVQATTEKINVNTASSAELTALPGIGKAYADRIVQYREKNGPFKKIEDLLNVQGIGEKTLERIRDRVTVSK